MGDQLIEYPPPPNTDDQDLIHLYDKYDPDMMVYLESRSSGKLLLPILMVHPMIQSHHPMVQLRRGMALNSITSLWSNGGEQK